MTTSTPTGGALPEAQVSNQGQPGYDVFGNPVGAAYTTQASPNGPINTPVTGSSQAPAASATPTATPAAPTIASLYGSESPSDQDVDTSVGVYKNAANTPVDDAGIRANALSSLQTEIDATNAVYAEKMRQAQITGANDLGSNAAISARRGLLGSDFGTQANDKVASNNAAVYSGIDADREAAIAGITDKGNTLAQQEIQDKTTAKQNGAQDYINFLSEQGTRQSTRTNNAASAIVSSGIDTTTLSPDDIANIAKSYNIAPAALTSALVSTKASVAAAQKANLVQAPITDNVYSPDGKGGLNQVQTGTATPDSLMKEWQAEVAAGTFSGSLSDYGAQKANEKVSDSVTHDPLTGGLQVVQRAGPQVAGTALPKTTASTTPAVTLPSATQKIAAAVNPATKPPTAPVVNPLDILSGSELAYAQTGLPTQAKFKYPGQIDQATKDIQAVIPGWTPATATASYAFFKSPDTQTFIANSNTVLNSLNLLKTLSSKVSRNDFQIANGQIISLKAGVSDQNAANFLQAAKIAGDEGGKLLGSAGGSDFTTQLGLSLINTNYSDATFASTMDQLAGRVNNKVSEYYKQAGIAAGDQAPTSSSSSTLPPEVDTALTSNAKIDDAAKTVTLPRAVWSTFGPNMDAVLAGIQAKGYKLLIQ